MKLLAALALLLVPLAATAQDGPPIPEPVGFVNDHAGLLDEGTRDRLEGFLDHLKQKTGAEFAILTMSTTAPADPSEYKVRVFEKWGLGRAGEDDGLLMLVAVEEREVRFETGYGLEGALPDGLQSRIFRQEMRPHFRQGDFAAGITAGVLRCASRIAAERGVTLEWDGRALRYEPRARRLPLWIVLIAFLMISSLISIVARRSGYGPRARRGGGWWYGGPGGYTGWGGGFGGGAGRGGGSFGGFSGGMSGGGGGGGSW